MIANTLLTLNVRIINLIITKTFERIPLSSLQRTSYGSDLLERVFAFLDLVERDHFGLRFKEPAGAGSGEAATMHCH